MVIEYATMTYGCDSSLRVRIRFDVMTHNHHRADFAFQLVKKNLIRKSDLESEGCVPPYRVNYLDADDSVIVAAVFMVDPEPAVADCENVMHHVIRLFEQEVERLGRMAAAAEEHLALQGVIKMPVAGVK